MDDSTELSFYEAAGGEEAFRRLVSRFYAEVAEDRLLRPVYPGADLGPAEEHLRLFLIQYWGGPVPTASSAAIRSCACATPRSESARLSGTHGWVTCAPRSTNCGLTRNWTRRSGITS